MLALRTHIAPSVWVDMGRRGRATAFHLLDQADRRSKAGRDTEGRQMSG